MILRRVQPSEGAGLKAWIKAFHYTGATPPGYRVALEFLEGKHLIGGMLLGRPTSRELHPNLILELTRMVFIDDTPKNTESQALGMMRKWVRCWMQEIRLLLAYSDPSVGHQGIVYLADGWAPFGMTHNSKIGWRNRPNRRAEQPSRKQRWVRTP